MIKQSTGLVGNLDSEAVSLSVGDLNGVQLDAVGLVQDGLSGDPETLGGLVERWVSVGYVEDESMADVVGEPIPPRGVRRGSARLGGEAGLEPAVDRRLRDPELGAASTSVVGRCLSSGSMRTLVISDLHLGEPRRRDVLTRRAPLAALLEALADVERLVLLGDAAELSERNPECALAVAKPILRALGRRLGSAREVILVPGNHDRAFVAPWIQRMGARLSVDSSVPLDATAELAAVSSWLAPALVSARYPGRVAVRTSVGHPRPLPQPSPFAGLVARRHPRTA